MARLVVDLPASFSPSTRVSPVDAAELREPRQIAAQLGPQRAEARRQVGTGLGVGAKLRLPFFALAGQLVGDRRRPAELDADRREPPVPVRRGLIDGRRHRRQHVVDGSGSGHVDRAPRPAHRIELAVLDAVDLVAGVLDERGAFGARLAGVPALEVTGEDDPRAVALAPRPAIEGCVQDADAEIARCPVWIPRGEILHHGPLAVALAVEGRSGVVIAVGRHDGDAGVAKSGELPLEVDRGVVVVALAVAPRSRTAPSVLCSRYSGG